MADRDFKPEEGGFFQIMNEFADKLVEYGLDRNEVKLLFLVMRRTWGVKGQAWSVLKWDYIMEKTKLSRSSVSDARSKLMARNILHTKSGKKPKELFYKINSKISTWIDEAELVRSTEPKKGLGLVRSTEPSWFGPPNQLVRSTEPVPLKDIILKTDCLKTNTGDVCVPSPNIEILTPKEQLEEDAKSVLDCLNELSGKEFTYTIENLEPIIERLENGATVDHCFKVCFNKWEDISFQNQFFRPSTLFKKARFEDYLNSKGTKYKPASKSDARRYEMAKTMYRRHHERENARQQEPEKEN